MIFTAAQGWQSVINDHILNSHDYSDQSSIGIKEKFALNHYWPRWSSLWDP